VSFFALLLSAVLTIFAEKKEFNNQVYYLKAFVLRSQRENLKKEVERTIYYLNFLKTELPDSSIEELQNRALNYLEDIRLGKDGYIFINTYDGVALLFDGNRNYDKKDVTKITDPTGLKVFEKEMELVKLPDGGFFEYEFKKITDNRPSPKISYVKGYDDWKWIVGAGDYLDNLSRETTITVAEYNQNLKANLFRILGLFIFALGFSVLLAFITAALIQKQFTRFVHLFKTKEIQNKKSIDAFDELFIRDLQNIGVEIMKAHSSAKEFGNLVDESLNEIFIFDQETYQFIHANKGALKNTGYSFAELSLMTPLDLKPQITKKEFEKLIQPLLENKAEFVFFETVHQRKNKSSYFASIHIATSVFNNKAVFVAFIYDSTEQKETKNQLIESEIRYKELFENAPIALWEEDFTAVVDYLQHEIENYKLPLPELLEKHPEIVFKCSDLALVTNLNEQVLKIYEAPSKELLLGNLSKIFTDNSFQTYKESLLAMMRGDSYFESESVNKTLLGTEFNALLRWSYFSGPFNMNLKVIVSVVNISEIKRIEKKLTDSEARFRSLFENNHTIMFLINQETGRFIDANPAAVNFYGYSKEEFIGHLSVFDLNTLSKEDALLKMQEAIQKKQAFFNFKHRKANGEIRDVEVYSGTLIFEQNTILFFIVHDVTDKKQAENLVLESKNKLENILRTAPTGVGVVADRVFTEVNNRFCEMTGYSAEELIGEKTVLIYPTIEEYERVGKEKYLQIREKGFGTVETLFRQKNGKIINVLMSSSPLDMNDFDKGVTFTALDISDRKKAEAELSHSHELMRYVIEHSQSDIAIHDHNLNYLYVSQSYLKHYKIKEENVIGKHHYAVFPDLPQKWRDVHQKALQGEISSAEKDAYERADGSVDWTRWECRPWYEADGSVGGIIVYTEVITERLRELVELENHRNHLEEIVKERTVSLEENKTALLNLVDDLNQESLKLDAANKKLEEINEELETFTYSVSHDLKAPLRGIDGYSQLLIEDFQNELSPEALSFLTTIRKSTQQMNLLIEDLLAYSRMERKDFKSESTAIFVLVNRIMQQFTKQLEENKATIINTLPLSLRLPLDKEGFELVIRNLIDNAIKFSANTKKPQIEVGCVENSTTWIIFVKDNGLGFDMKYHDRIFQIFQRLHLAEEYKGTGIGLAMVNKALQRMNAKIWAESELNKGATFYIEIKKGGGE
jgi:PAS domain S-box-containing protein